MNEERKFPIGMVVKVLIVLAIPLLLFLYIDSQPAPVETSGVSSASENLTKSVAVVNEDLGYDTEEETINLGVDIPTVLNEQLGEGDYNWTVVSRSAAEQGMNDQTYDAILYIPSNFTENILTFQEEAPMEASLNYMVQPMLTAKEQENIHRMMANANGAINEEMSTIYWGYITQEVGNMKEQFDAILEKEIEFQEAMYSFYAPSSETLANQIQQQLNSLESILQQTTRVDELSSDSANAADEAEAQVAAFAEALEAYKQANFQQQELLADLHAENQAVIQLYQDQMNGQFDEYQPPILVTYGNQQMFHNHFTGVEEQLSKGANIFSQWQSDATKNQMNREWKEVNQAVLEVYNQGLYNEASADLRTTIYEIRGIPIEEESPASSEPPEDGDETNIDGWNLLIEDLENEMNQMKALIENLRHPDDAGDAQDSSEQGDENGTNAPEDDSDNDGQNSDDGNSEQESAPAGSENSVDNATDNLSSEETGAANTDSANQTETAQDGTVTTQSVLESNVDFASIESSLQQLKDMVQRLEEGSDNSEQLKTYAEDYQSAYEELTRNGQNTSDNLIEHALAKQQHILTLLSEDEGEQYASEFLSVDEMSGVSPGQLYEYINDLTDFESIVSEQDNITPSRVDNILDNPKVSQEINDLLAVDSQYADQLSAMFDSLMGESDEVGEIADVEQSFHQLVTDVEIYLTEYETYVEEEQENILTNLDALIAATNEIAEQLQTINSGNFEGGVSPGAGQLNGQMVVTVQQGTASNMEQLSSMVSSLGESQSNVTGATEELQNHVNSVQDEADTLNDNWSTNVDTTFLIRDDVHAVLENAVVDGQENPAVYDHLSSPVHMQDEAGGQVLAETEQQTPPVVMLIIILISGLMIGFISHYYSQVSFITQGAVFLLMNLAAGLIICIYGLSVYGMGSAQAILWSFFTILLLMASSNVVRAGLFIGPFVGWMVSIGVILFFISPLLNIVITDFSFDNPIASVYMALQYGGEAPVILTMFILTGIILVVSAFIYGLQVMLQKDKVDDADEEKAS